MRKKDTRRLSLTTCTEGTMWGHGELVAICNLGRGLIRNNPDGTFLLDFQLPELREHKFVKNSLSHQTYRYCNECILLWWPVKTPRASSPLSWSLTPLLLSMLFRLTVPSLLPASLCVLLSQHLANRAGHLFPSWGSVHLCFSAPTQSWAYSALWHC